MLFYPVEHKESDNGPAYVMMQHELGYAQEIPNPRQDVPLDQMENSFGLVNFVWQLKQSNHKEF